MELRPPASLRLNALVMIASQSCWLLKSAYRSKGYDYNSDVHSQSNVDEMVPAIGMEGPALRNNLRYTRLFMTSVIVQ